MSFSIGALFSAIWPWLLGMACLIGVIGLLVFLLWFLLGRKKNGEDKTIGVMRQMSAFRGCSNNGPGSSGTGSGK